MKETEDRLEKAAKQKETKQKTNLRKGTQGKLAGANSSLGSRLSILLGILGLLILCSLSVPIVTMGSKAVKSNLDKNMEDLLDLTSEKTGRIFAQVQTLSASMMESISFVWGQDDLVGGAPANPWRINNFNDGAREVQEITPMQNTTFRSRILNQEIPASRYNAEVVMMNALYSTLKSNPYVTGVGYFFEPDVLIPGATNYAPYLTVKSAETRDIINYPYSYYQNKGYYKNARDTQKATITSLYHDDEYPEYALVTVCDPIIVNGEFKGVVTIEINLAAFDVLEREDSRFPSLFTSVMDDQGNFLYSSREDLREKTLNDALDEKEVPALLSKMQEDKPFHVVLNNKAGQSRRLYFTPTQLDGTTLWSLMSISSNEYLSVTKRLITVSTVIVLLGVIILIALTNLLIRSSLKPLQMMAKVGNQVAEGNLNVDIQYHRQDEIGTIAQAFDKVMQQVKSIIRDLNEKLSSVSNGDFRVDLADESIYKGDYKPLLLSLREITTDLSRTMEDIKRSATEVNSGAEQVSNGAQSLSQGSTEQASSIEELSATMNEMSAKIKSTAEQSAEANKLSLSSVDAVELSNQKMEEMSLAMKEITEKSNEISKIIKTIDDIAFQTNILSLNAAIEAARAGAAGKGFAVVADEVGNLAQKSAKAAQNTSSLIEETIDAVSRGAKITQETAESMDLVKNKAEGITAIISKISDASEEEARGIVQLSTGLDQISSVVQSNTATAEQSAAASEELSGQANVLQDLVSKFQLKNDN